MRTTPTILELDSSLHNIDGLEFKFRFFGIWNINFQAFVNWLFFWREEIKKKIKVLPMTYTLSTADFLGKVNFWSTPLPKLNGKHFCLSTSIQVRDIWAISQTIKMQFFYNICSHACASPMERMSTIHAPLGEKIYIKELVCRWTGILTLVIFYINVNSIVDAGILQLHILYNLALEIGYGP